MAGKVSSLFLLELRPAPSRWIPPSAKNKGTNAAATQSLKHFWRRRLRERGKRSEKIKRTRVLENCEGKRENDSGKGREGCGCVRGGGGVRTNAICMILHVLARPGAPSLVSAVCLRFLLAFLATEGVPSKGFKCDHTTMRETDKREEIIFLGFSSTKVLRAPGISIRSSFTHTNNPSFLPFFVSQVDFRCFIFVFLWIKVKNYFFFHPFSHHSFLHITMEIYNHVRKRPLFTYGIFGGRYFLYYNKHYIIICLNSF